MIFIIVRYFINESTGQADGIMFIESVWESKAQAIMQASALMGEGDEKRYGIIERELNKVVRSK